MAKNKRANGEGCISKITDKKTGKTYWKAVMTLGRDDNGKLIRKQLYGKTQKEAKEKLEEYKEKNNKGLLSVDEKQTLQQWFKTWLFEHRANDLRPSSLERYDGIYRNYIRNSDIGMVKLKDLRTDHIRSFYNSLQKNQNKTPDTIKSINKVLKCALNQAVKENLIPINYCNNLSPIKTEHKEEVEIFTLEEQKKFINAIQNHRHRALFLLALGSGLRIGELIALKWSDINFISNELKVERTFKRVAVLDNKDGNKTKVIPQLPKTKYSIRTIPIPSNIIKELKNHRIRQLEERMLSGEAYVDNDLIFPTELGTPTDSRSLSRSYERVLKNTEIPHKKFHSLRHTYATRLFENDESPKTVQMLMGHSSIKITLDIYTHVMPEIKIEAAEKLNHLFAL